MTHLKTALSQVGVKEILGKDKHNPEVLKYFLETGHSWVKNDETAWCSAFVNWVAKVNCLEMSNKLNARSWMSVGKLTNTPDIGDVVVLWRESKSSWKGHVGFYIRETKNWIYVLGGNQSNQVKISAYHKSRLLGYRKLRNI